MRGGRKVLNKIISNASSNASNASSKISSIFKGKPKNNEVDENNKVDEKDEDGEKDTNKKSGEGAKIKTIFSSKIKSLFNSNEPGTTSITQSFSNKFKQIPSMLKNVTIQGQSITDYASTFFDGLKKGSFCNDNLCSKEEYEEYIQNLLKSEKLLSIGPKDRYGTLFNVLSRMNEDIQSLIKTEIKAVVVADQKDVTTSDTDNLPVVTEKGNNTKDGNVIQEGLYTAVKTNSLDVTSESNDGLDVVADQKDVTTSDTDNLPVVTEKGNNTKDGNVIQEGLDTAVTTNSLDVTSESNDELDVNANFTKIQEGGASLLNSTELKTQTKITNEEKQKIIQKYLFQIEKIIIGLYNKDNADIVINFLKKYDGGNYNDLKTNDDLISFDLGKLMEYLNTFQTNYSTKKNDSFDNFIKNMEEYQVNETTKLFEKTNSI